MAANQIYIQVDFQSQSANAAITTLNQNIQSIANTSNQATAQASQGVKGFSVTVDQARTAIDSLAQSLIGLSIAHVVREVAMLGDELIRVRLGFANVKDGIDAWNNLRQVAEQTGFAFQDVANNANALKNAGVPIGEISRALKILADQAAYAGASQAGLTRAAETFANIWTKQKITGRELTAFREIGLQPVQVVLDKLHVSAQKFYEDTRLLNARPVLRSILDFAQQQSAGAGAARLEQLPSAQFNLLRNDAARLAEELMTTLTPALISVVKALRGLLDTVQDVMRAFQSWPEWLRTLAETLLLVAVAAKAVSSAMLLWNALPGMLTWIVPAAMKAAAAIGEIGIAFKVITSGVVVNGLDAIGVGLTGLTGAAGGLMAVLLPILPELLAIAAAWALVTAARGAASDSDDANAQMYRDQRARAKLAYQAEDLARTLSAANQQKVGFQGGGSFFAKSTEDLTKLIATMRGLQAKEEALLAEDEAKREQAIKKASDLLDESRRRNLLIGKESIAALTYAYEQHYRDVVAGGKKAAAMVRQAFLEDIDTEVKKRHEELKKENEKAVQETLAIQRRIEVAQAQVTPDDTFAGRVALLRLEAAAEERQIREQTYLKNEATKQVTDKQIEGIRAVTPHGIAEAVYLASKIKALQDDANENRVKENALADDKVALHRIDSEARANALLEQQRKQQADERLQDEIDFIDQTRQMRMAQLGAAQPESLPARLQQMREMYQAQVDATVRTRDARIAAARAEYEYFRQQHPGATQSIEEEYAKFVHTRTQLEHAANVEINLDRIQLWKESNDAIIAEQKRVYEGVKGALDKVWDALMDRSKSVWASIGNALKTAILNAMKEIVTSRLAAGIASLFGYGPYTFKRGITGIYEPPSPAGLGGAGLPEMLPIGGGVGSGLMAPYTGGGGLSLNRMLDTVVGPQIRQAQQQAAAEAQVSATGSAGRMADDAEYNRKVWTSGADTSGAVAAAAAPQAQQQRASLQRSMQNLQRTFNIGQPVNRIDDFGNVHTVPWASATGKERLGAILTSPGAMQMAFGMGSMLAISGFQRGGVSGGAQGIAGSALAGVGLAGMVPALGLTYLGGGLLGAGIGIAAAGLMRGGKIGAAMSAGGGALAGAVIGTAIFPGLGTLAGAAIGAAVGGIAGLIRLGIPSMQQRVHDEIKRVYSVDIKDKGILKQIADVISQRYGGSVSVGIYSQDVQDIVRLYALSTGQGLGGVPRPMYSAAFAQSQAGGLQLQPVYQGGQLVPSPYTGITTSQLTNQLYGSPAVYMQLNPQQAQDLFEGRVTQVISGNPGTVAQANAQAARAGDSRLAQASALTEPMTVTR